jgi:hypothetical protein
MGGARMERAAFTRMEQTPFSFFSMLQSTRPAAADLGTSCPGSCLDFTPAENTPSPC